MNKSGNQRIRTRFTRKDVAGIRLRNADFGVRTPKYLVMVMAGLAVGRKENMGYDPDAPPSADSMTVADVEAMVAGLGEPDLAASALEFVRNLAKVTPGIAGSSGYGISGGRLAIVNDARQLLGMPVLVWDEAHGTWKEDG